MNFSAYSIRRPIPAILLFILLTIAGLISFSGMKVQDSPDLDFPVVFVHSYLPGASPPQLEAEVARKIENSLASISHVRRIYTTISDGAVETSIQFHLEKDVSEAMADVRDAVGRVRSDLPVDLRDPVISKLDLAGVPFLTYSVSSENKDEVALSWLVDNKLSKALLLVPGVGKVSRIGGVNREVLVELDPARMAALNVSAADISRQLQLVQQEASGGKATISGVNQSVRTIGTVRSVEELASLNLALSDGRRVRLGEVARVVDSSAERRSITLLDGKQVIGFDITRNKGASELEVAAAVREAVEELAATEPQVKIAEAFNSVDSVQDNYAGSMTLLYEGALLTVLVVWLFLRDWRATLVSAVALPLSIIPTFLIMSWLGFTLNMITLLSLALVVGILVDDAIVEIENIMRHLRMGKTPMQAALDAAEEIGLAVVATTATLVAVFLPTAFMSGVVGQYFKQFGWTTAIAVGASLVVARVLTPMMAAYLLKPMPQAKPDGRLMQYYLAAAAWCLRHRRRTLLLAGAFFIGSLMMIPMLQTAFFPPANGIQTQVTLELAPGATLDETAAVAEQARALLTQDPDVVQVFSAIGGGEAHRAALTVSLKPRAERERKQVAINTALRARLLELPGVRTTVGSADEASEDLTISLVGDDPEALKKAAQAIQRQIRTIPGLGSIYSDVSVLRPEVIVTPDSARAADLGVSAAAIGDTLRVATAGDYEQNLSKLNLPERQIPIRVRLPESARHDIGVLERLSVPGKSGNVPLSSVAEVRIDSGVARIDRRDRANRVVIHVELNGRDYDEVDEKVDDLASLQELPPGVHRGRSDMEMQKELFSNFGMAMLTGVLCVYMVLVLLFGGFMQPITVMAALPLAIGGAFGALLLTGSSLSMPSLLGLLMLMGIAAKNSILLVDYAMRARRERGVSVSEALLDACHKRVQPIVMTSVAMAAGMLPIAIGLGADPSLRAPMAIAVIGGLLSSTMLSLLVIPVVYSYVDDIVARRARRRSEAVAASPVMDTLAPLPSP